MSNMSKSQKITTVIIFIVMAAVTFGFIYDGIVTFGEKKDHPQTYSPSVSKYANEYGVPESVIYAIIKVESNFNPNTVSSKGAVGLMQLTMPAVEDVEAALNEDIDESDLYNTDINIKYGTYYLSILRRKYENWDTVAAAYNYGQGNVDKLLSDPTYSKDGITLDRIPVSETSKYVRLVREARTTYERLYY